VSSTEGGAGTGPGRSADRHLLDETVGLARQAGELSLKWFGSSRLQVDRKRDGTPVTEADRAIERLLREEIGRRHPGDGIVGEEESEKGGTTGRRWIIDPIDGTKAFTRGVPLYSNLLAVEDDSGVLAGVVNVPAIGEMVWAGRGLGCFFNDEPARVSGHDRLAGAYVSTSGFDGWDDDSLLRVKEAGPHLRTWGDGYGYLLVATGRVDAMVDPQVAIHDLAPMPVIISEAGGRFTDFDGTDAAIRSGTALASNGLVHRELLAALNP
jgi:histidinol-phosphatase